MLGLVLVLVLVSMSMSRFIVFWGAGTEIILWKL